MRLCSLSLLDFLFLNFRLLYLVLFFIRFNYFIEITIEILKLKKNSRFIITIVREQNEFFLKMIEMRTLCCENCFLFNFFIVFIDVIFSYIFYKKIKRIVIKY